MLAFLSYVAFVVVVAASIVAGALLGGGVKFSRFGSNGPALIGSGVAFATCLTVAVSTGGVGLLGWSFSALTAAFFGVMVRGAAR